MHGLLALSALHLARTGDQYQRVEYTAVAAEHQNDALALFRPLLQDINGSNCDAMFAFASVMSILAFASLPLSSSVDSRIPIDDLLQVFTLCRGVHEVLRISWDWVHKGRLARLFETDDTEQSLPENLRRAIAQVEDLNKSRNAEDSRHDTGTYGIAIESLRQMLEIFQRNPMSTHAAVRWPISLPLAFLDCLRRHEPMALVIVAHYCILLDRLKEHWWIEGWSTKVMGAIWRDLDENWRPSIQWAMDEIGGRVFCGESGPTLPAHRMLSQRNLGNDERAHGLTLERAT
jgi:hypothetical protein